MTARFASLAAIATVVVSPGSLHAGMVTVTFDTFTGQHAFFADNPTATSEGFDFTSSLLHFHLGDSLPGSPGTTSVLLQDLNQFSGLGDNIVTMTRHGGGAFDLLSIDAAHGGINGPFLEVTGVFSGGGSITTTTASILPVFFQQLNFSGFTNLTSVSFKAVGGTLDNDIYNTFWLDNVVVNDPPAVTSDVPAPPGWQLVLLGAGALFVTHRRRSVVALRSDT